MRTTVFVAALTLVAAGCGARPVATEQEASGAAHLIVGARSERVLQYLVSDIKAVKVTIKNAADNSLVRQDLFTGAALAAKLPVNSRVFSFTVDHLKVSDTSHPAGYGYKATVEAFREGAATTSLGVSTSDAFAVQNAQTSSIPMPALTLVPTPTGSWQVTVNVALAKNWAIDRYILSLEQTDRQVASISVSTGATSISRTFNNVLAFPAGTSTLSIMVDGHRTVGQKEALTTTDTLTATMQPGASSVSTRNLTLP